MHSILALFCKHKNLIMKGQLVRLHSIDLYPLPFLNELIHLRPVENGVSIPVDESKALKLPVRDRRQEVVQVISRIFDALNNAPCLSLKFDSESRSATPLQQLSEPFFFEPFHDLAHVLSAVTRAEQ